MVVGLVKSATTTSNAECTDEADAELLAEADNIFRNPDMFLPVVSEAEALAA